MLDRVVGGYWIEAIEARWSYVYMQYLVTLPSFEQRT